MSPSTRSRDPRLAATQNNKGNFGQSADLLCTPSMQLLMVAHAVADYCPNKSYPPLSQFLHGSRICLLCALCVSVVNLRPSRKRHLRRFGDLGRVFELQQFRVLAVADDTGDQHGRESLLV